ncbi:Histidine phosphatase superfamily clade-2 [Penicillium argentinense]|uniref:Histidine phosphatase superfamily clade-2 n=1 Tax=Penicillium argentinense TaxID=1131581 RepID=A0A9W9JXI7_9EURO|nr:Histidine phosphatase superfamily clade-2 [Penicillium argentinense]KAJ5085243.1 Histidine phosphatase superfamily clade-2 [Penicillium argentinense]
MRTITFTFYRKHFLGFGCPSTRHNVNNQHFGALMLALAAGSAALPWSSTATSSSAAAPTGTPSPPDSTWQKAGVNSALTQILTGLACQRGPPRGCELSQVHVLHRHAQRYPVSSDFLYIATFVSASKNYTTKHPHAEIGPGTLASLNEWEVCCAKTLLFPQARPLKLQLGQSSGRHFYDVARAQANWNGSFLQNARWRLSGFFSNTGANSSLPEYDHIIMPEKTEYNDTLSSSSCLKLYDLYSFGSPAGRALDIGYAQELAARLEHKLIKSSDSSINSTYDDNAKDFPLDQPFYIDIPCEMPAKVPHALPRGFKLKNMVPFGARLVTEVWTFPKNTSFHDLQSLLYKNPDLFSKSTEHYNRLALNNAPVPLDGLSACQSVNGFCSVKSFLRQVPKLTKEAKYEEACFASYNATISADNGQPPKK